MPFENLVRCRECRLKRLNLPLEVLKLIRLARLKSLLAVGEAPLKILPYERVKSYVVRLDGLEWAAVDFDFAH